MSAKDPETLRKIHRTYYLKHKDEIKARRAKWKQERQMLLNRYVYEYLLKHPCVDCGESDPIVLEFDHRDGAQKEANIANLVAQSRSLERLRNEINKCEVRCANCHRIRTAKAQGYYRYLYQQQEVREECAPYWIVSAAA